MRTVTQRARAVVLAAVGLLLLTSCDFSVYSLPLPGGADTGDEPMTITAEFRDVLDLVPQSTVKVNDADVGRITDVRVDDWTAVVDMEIRGDLELPADAFARIRQTSLLGEKFVSLEAPEGGGSGLMESGDTIPLERSGRNPEVEEVLGALSLLLNGGGVGQLQVISRELNDALGGREPELRSALRRLDRFATVLDDNRDDVVDAIDSLNDLAIGANAQTETIELALDELPSSALSVNRQRDALVDALTSLDQLSDVGVQVIQESREGTIESLELLEPVLRQLANADDDLAFSIPTLLTFPFVDETVGRDPQVARSIEFGDYVNLDIQLDLRLGSVGDLVDVICSEVDAVALEPLLQTGLPVDVLQDLLEAVCASPAVDEIQECLNGVGAEGSEPADLLSCLGGLIDSVPQTVCTALAALTVPLLLPGCTGEEDETPVDPAPGPGVDPGPDTGPDPDPDPPVLPVLPVLPDLPGGGGGDDGGGGGGGGGDEGGDRDGSLLDDLLGRAAPNPVVSGTDLTTNWVLMGDLAQVYDPDLTMLLVPPMSRANLTGGAS